jgi:AcrR family transcriptional regulator
VAKRQLRADAKRNRAHVLAIAERVFADEGLAVPIDEIAKRAGVGIGTVYRHFPTKETLFAAIVHDRMERLVDHAASLASDPKPGDAFFAVLERMIADGAHKKDLVDALTSTGVDIRAQGQDVQARLHKALGHLLKRAHAAKAVRAGIAVDDVLALMAATFHAARRVGSSPAKLFAVVVAGLRAV